MTTPISVAELAARLHQVQIIDVRRRPAFDASSHMVTGAVWRNPDEAAQWAANIVGNRAKLNHRFHLKLTHPICA
jgi:thiosulfate sulfurtransferase